MEQASLVGTVLDQPKPAVWRSSSVLIQATPAETVETEWVPVKTILPANSPRQAGEDIEHTRMLASVDQRLPPIIVHRSSMRVIDGNHRLGAALLRGDELIEVRFFDGSEQEAFVLAVQTNIAHGLPLSLADRTRAAERIIASHPNWSDRAIASVTGLGARTVGNVRRRSLGGGDGEVRARTGRDGRVRPLDNAEGRLRASAIIRERPGASLREVAREAGVSPSTVRDVRKRIERGEDPVPSVRRGRGDGSGVKSFGVGGVEGPRLASMLRGLQSDPSLRFTESGRMLLRWIFSRAIRSDERLDVVGKVPPHCTYIVANVARVCADEWLQLANELEQRTAETA
ncbi:ParB/RepB/Spo0J family partition protein [Phytohabitans houttuyneae]|uniref:ParB/RepB/Spo0J family partition protein n=1 Tax=Phytohabitans houttuyneae TaxID=1076126 RepID=UPI001C499EBF|nr:helix-turn-helix domain-containing protein [Phytohabitans houttuyneae]